MCCCNSVQEASPCTPMRFQQSDTRARPGSRAVSGDSLIGQSLLNDTLQALMHHSSAYCIPCLFQEQSEVGQALVMIGVEIKRFAVVLARLGKIAGGGSDETQEKKGLHRRAKLAQI